MAASSARLETIEIRAAWLLDVPDSATAVAHVSVDPSVQAGIFILDNRPWWGPFAIDLTGSAPNAPHHDDPHRQRMGHAPTGHRR